MNISLLQSILRNSKKIPKTYLKKRSKLMCKYPGTILVLSNTKEKFKQLLAK